MCESDERTEPVCESDERTEPVCESDERTEPVCESDERTEPVCESDERTILHSECLSTFDHQNLFKMYFILIIKSWFEDHVEHLHLIKKIQFHYFFPNILLLIVQRNYIILNI